MRKTCNPNSKFLAKNSSWRRICLRQKEELRSLRKWAFHHNLQYYNYMILVGHSSWKILKVISYVFYVVILFVIQFNSCSCFVRFYDHCIRHNITHFVSMSHSFYPEDQYEYGNLFDKVRFSWPQSGILTWFYSSVSKKNSWAFLRAFEWRMLRLQSWSVEQKSVSATEFSSPSG